MQYQFNGGPTLVNAYRLTGLTSSNATTRDPKDFALMGSHNGNDWVTLHSQAGVTGWAVGQQRFYALPNDTAYAYYRFAITANNGDGTYTGLNELEFFLAPSPPAIENLPASNVLVDSGWMNGSLTVTGTAATAVMVYWGSSDGGTTASAWANTNTWAAPQQKGAFSHQATGLSTNDTCYYRYAATNDVGLSWAGETAAFITGEVWIERVSDGAEEGLVPGSFRVVRSSATTEASLSVFYAQTGGTAQPGVDFVPLSGQVVIPAGETSAVITVTPIGNYADPNDKTVTLSVLPQGYLVGAPAAATLTIENQDVPADKNVWVAPSAGNASVAANWSQGVPTAGDDILLDLFSTADMTWDAGVNGLPDTVASWTQTADYTGAVTFNTTYPAVATVFTNFTVSGSAQVLAGKWTHPANASTQMYRLKAAVGGDFTLGTAAKIDVQGRGYAATKFPSAGAVGVHGGSRSDFGKVYGDVYRPESIGAGAEWGSLGGGGAVWIEVAGLATIDGSINAKAADSGSETAIGAGGSIYIKAGSASGAATLDVSGKGYYGQTSGSGGRIAVELTSASVLGLDPSKFLARGGWGGTSTGAGTIFIKTANQAHGQLIVDNYASRTYGCQPPTKYGTTCIAAGETWTFDSILFRNYGVLSVPAGTALALPNGLASVSSLNTSFQSGILYMGGTLDLGAAPQWNFTSNWVFQADSPYVITGNVTVIDGGALGCIPLLRNSLSAYADMDLSIVGNLNIASTGRIIADNAGVDWNGSPYSNSTKGFHGGQSAFDTANKAYGSVFNPVLPGVQAQDGDYATIRGGGGAVRLVVSGLMNVDGAVSSSSLRGSYNAGAGGSLNIRAGALAGLGSIRANGGAGSSSKYAGGGGRVAVRLTGSGSTFDAFGVAKISATGVSTSSTTPGYLSSAGTVYLQDESDEEGAGQVIIRNDNSAINTASVTWFPSLASGGEADVFDAASLSIEAYARVKLAASLRMQQATMSAGTVLDVNGKTLIVRTLQAGGENVPSGTYAAGSTLFTDGYVVDSVGGGSVVVLGAGTVVVVR